MSKIYWILLKIAKIPLIKPFAKFSYKLMKKIYAPLAKFKWEREIFKRSKLSVFQYKELSKDLTLGSDEFASNAYYGNYKAIKRFIGQKDSKILNGTIQHGLQFSDYLWEVETKHPSNVMYTFSEYRKMLIEKYVKDRKIIAVGPYIKYVDSSMSDEEISQLKKAFGKTLLVFTAHSSHYEHTNFDDIAFMEEIKKIRKRNGFDTVIICAYWKDVLRGKYEPYEKTGNYTIVSAGHIFDTNFLNRLKSIILLSDVTMSNGIGTHVGYCICLKKPHYIYRQKVEINYDYNDTQISGMSEMTEMASTFSSYQENIDNEQIELVEKYWGKWGDE